MCDVFWFNGDDKRASLLLERLPHGQIRGGPQGWSPLTGKAALLHLTDLSGLSRDDRTLLFTSLSEVQRIIVYSGDSLVTVKEEISQLGPVPGRVELLPHVGRNELGVATLLELVVCGSMEKFLEQGEVNRLSADQAIAIGMLAEAKIWIEETSESGHYSVPEGTARVIRDRISQHIQLIVSVLDRYGMEQVGGDELERKRPATLEECRSRWSDVGMIISRNSVEQ